MEFTEDVALLKNPVYHKIRDVLSSLINNSTNKNSFAGNCVATCDIVQALLAQIGIPSKIIECQVSIVVNDNGTRQFVFVGYDNFNYPGQIDTHTVVVTDDENPILIDLSLGNQLPEGNQYIIGVVGEEKIDDNNQKKIIAEYKLKNAEVTYFVKTNLRLSSIHQKNLVQRIIKEQKFEKTINFVKTMLYCSLTLSVINFILNMALIIIKLTWG